jgi:hypothetical protein
MVDGSSIGDLLGKVLVIDRLRVGRFLHVAGKMLLVRGAVRAVDATRHAAALGVDA